MIVVWIIFLILFVCFGLVVFIGAPYVPSKNKDLNNIFTQLRLKKGSVIVDLGSGDGKVLIAAAKAGYNAVGYEINPILWAISKIRTAKYRRHISVRCQNLWRVNLKKADVVFVFTAAPFVKRLSRKFQDELCPGSKVVSYGFSLDVASKPEKKGSALIYKF